MRFVIKLNEILGFTNTGKNCDGIIKEETRGDND